MSFSTIKFYDTAVPDAPSIASIMATSGTFSSTGMNMAETPTHTEKKEDPKPASDAAPADTATPTSTAATATPESPKPEEKATVGTPQTEEPPKQIQWQEVLKQQQPDTVLKELGYDDKVIGLLKDAKTLDPKMIAFLDHWKSKGDVTSYLKELTTDYSKMPPEDVLRQQLQREYPKASGKALDALLKEELGKYKLDPDMYSPEEVEMSQLLLEAKADKFRDTLMAEQEKFLLPPAPEPKQPEPDLQEQKSRQEFEAYKATISEHSYTKSLIASKELVIGEGEEQFRFPVDPSSLLDLVLDSDKWVEAISLVEEAPDGSKKTVPNVEKRLLMAGIAKYGNGFLKEYAQHFKSLGGKAINDQLENPKKPETGTPSAAQAAYASPAAAMAKEGRLV